MRQQNLMELCPFDAVQEDIFLGIIMRMSVKKCNILNIITHFKYNSSFTFFILLAKTTRENILKIIYIIG